jgi:thiol-disulfide isomerase/thioredoxin
MRAAWPRTLGFLVLACILVAALGGVSDARRRDAQPATGLKNVAYAKTPPDFAFDLGTGTTHLHDLVGKPVVLNFWATWCKPCRDELDAFAKLGENYGERVSLLTIAAQPRGVASSFLQQHELGARLPLVEDDQRAVSDAYSIGDLPATIVLKRDGTVASVMIGQVRWEDLKAAVDAVL